MSRKNYTHIQTFLPEIKEMISAGKSHWEIEKQLGLSGTRPGQHLLTRERRKELQGIPKQRNRKPAKTLQEYKNENKR